MTFERSGRLQRAGRQSTTAALSEVLQRGVVTVEESASGTGQAVLHYHFPVEIEVRATSDPVDQEAIVQEVLSRLARSLKST